MKEIELSQLIKTFDDCFVHSQFFLCFTMYQPSEDTCAGEFAYNSTFGETGNLLCMGKMLPTTEPLLWHFQGRIGLPPHSVVGIRELVGYSLFALSNP